MQIVGHSAEKRLTQMDVRLHEAGDHRAAFGVDHACRIFSGKRARNFFAGSDLDDLLFADEHASVDHSTPRRVGVASHDGAAAHERLHRRAPYHVKEKLDHAASERDAARSIA